MRLKFIDLFSGIGAFHLAMDSFNNVCILASEIDKYAIDTYEKNFNINANINIRDIDEKDIENHDILCAGFPCFIAGTKVLTNNGYKNIEHIQIGDMVLTHKNRYKPVVAIGNTSNQEIFELQTEDNSKFLTTANHPFLVKANNEEGFILKEYKDLNVMDFLIEHSNNSGNGEISYIYKKIKSKAKIGLKTKVYNIEVQDDNTYIVENKFVHNCQTFSIAGKGLGFSDKIRGTLFFEIARILEEKHPKFIILENVKNLVNHDNGNTYKIIIETLKEIGYILPKEPIIMSPTQLGIPQERERVFILGIYKDYCNKEYLTFDLPNKKETSIYSILDDKVDSKYNISKYEETILNAWDEFHKHLYPHFGVVWVEEFGKTYDYSHFPTWKQRYIEKNRELYLNNKEFIDDWMEKYDVKNFKLRDKKFEWQAGKEINSVWECVIQLRQSGVRCKKPNAFQTLVAIVQTPIIGKYKRRLTPREAARLQSFPDNYKLNERDDKAYKQLGNSANVEVIKYLAKQLFKQANK